MAASKSGSTPEATTPTGQIHELNRTVETGTQRVQRLQHEAHELAREQVETLARDFNALVARAEEIAAGGEAYPAGVREIASRIAEDLPQKVLSMMAIMDRSPHD
jgi:uncharacterized protein YoxC